MGVGRLRVDARLEGDCVRVTVTDNGGGFPPEFKLQAGHGLHNIAERLRGYYGDRAAVRCENTPMGCQVTLTVPL